MRRVREATCIGLFMTVFLPKCFGLAGREVAYANDIPLPELALAWLLHQPAVDTVLVGASRPEQVTENAKAADVKLGADVLATLDEILGIDRNRRI